MYDMIIKVQEKKNIIEKIDGESIKGELKHYIPHYIVITPNKTTTTLRIVYHAYPKAKKSNASLNECLYRGTVILEHFGTLLLRFRTHKTTLVIYIEKAFLQVGRKEIPLGQRYIETSQSTKY